MGKESGQFNKTCRHPNGSVPSHIPFTGLLEQHQKEGVSQRTLSSKCRTKKNDCDHQKEKGKVCPKKTTGGHITTVDEKPPGDLKHAKRTRGGERMVPQHAGHIRVAVICKKVVQLGFPKMLRNAFHCGVVFLHFPSTRLLRRSRVLALRTVKRWNIHSRNIPIFCRVAKKHFIHANMIRTLKVMNTSSRVANSYMPNKRKNP
ncbi:hypothetical protein ECC02_001965 [Trypanosoma cruzi]|uniref:Uncharacterized protein n=1 Tax=Trypanosoma cruzi TaxID=5693 RepID=A0A7J6YE42_TRYCR|nr:hypothetical protein ECC02_001965 [Trypanosoma cruzi]